MMKIEFFFCTLLAALLVSAGCASAEETSKQRQVASIVADLYPDANTVPPPSSQVAELKVPFRIGVAFVPDNSNAEFPLSEKERINLASSVSDAFSG